MGFFSAKTFKRAALAGVTGGLSEFTHGADAFGVKSGLQALTGGGQEYTPQQLSEEDPKLRLAQSGGAPLLTQIALGVDVEDALAGYFGRSKGNDWDAYLKNLNPNEQAAINNVRSQLTEIQSNTNLRTQAVQKIVNDFPNIVSQTAPAIAQAKAQAGEEFDSFSKAAMDYALNSTASKYNAGGMLSSGAAAAAEARTGAQFGMDKLNYVNNQGNQAYDRNANDIMGHWQAQYNEANALRSFQQTMLGQGVKQGFSANQDLLNRNFQTQVFNTNASNQKLLMDNANSNATLNSVVNGATTGLILGAQTKSPLTAPATPTTVQTSNNFMPNAPRLTDYGANA